MTTFNSGDRVRMIGAESGLHIKSDGTVLKQQGGKYLIRFDKREHHSMTNPMGRSWTVSPRGLQFIAHAARVGTRIKMIDGGVGHTYKSPGIVVTEPVNRGYGNGRIYVGVEFDKQTRGMNDLDGRLTSRRGDWCRIIDLCPISQALETLDEMGKTILTPIYGYFDRLKPDGRFKRAYRRGNTPISVSDGPNSNGKVSACGEKKE